MKYKYKYIGKRPAQLPKVGVVGTNDIVEVEAKINHIHFEEVSVEMYPEEHTEKRVIRKGISKVTRKKDVKEEKPKNAEEVTNLKKNTDETV